jgi:CheY-like chemotaxis protein
VEPTTELIQILVVEDDELIREMMVELLTDAGFAVDAAETGDDAAELIDRHGYSLLLTGARRGCQTKPHGSSLLDRLPLLVGSETTHAGQRRASVAPHARNARGKIARALANHWGQSVRHVSRRIVFVVDGRFGAVLKPARVGRLGLRAGDAGGLMPYRSSSIAQSQTTDHAYE